MDFDLGDTGPAAAEPKGDFTPEGTLIMGAQEPEKTVSGLDFDLGGTEQQPAAAAPAEKSAEPSGLDFDLDIDTGKSAPGDEKSAPTPDLSSISLDLGSPGDAPAGGSDPKWQEVATKLDLAKA